MKTRTLLEGIGAALLLLIPYYCKFLIPSNLVLYHLRLPVRNLIGGLLLDLLIYFILVTALLAAIQYLPLKIQRIVGALFSGLMLWVIVDFSILALIHVGFPIEYWGRMWWQSAVAIPLSSGILAYLLPNVTQTVVNAIRLLVAAFAFSGIWIVPQLLYIAMTSQQDDAVVFTHLPISTHSESNTRIIWILFDELSYDQTFEHRAPGINLPNFESLRAGSVLFRNLKPTGNQTDLIIPSLFLNQRIDEIRSSINGQLLYKDASQHRWVPYDPEITLFGLAQRNGWTTGAAGWVVPLCRILAPVLNACSWEPVNLLPNVEYGASEQKSVWTNALVFPNRFWVALTGRTTTPADAHIAEAHIQDYRDIMEHARTLIDDRHVRFIFLHLPVPHPPGKYDRKRHMLVPSGTYLDNLVLADDTLGVLMQEIQANPSAIKTTVVVSSDHSWRVPLWRHAELWSDEEERSSMGRFDDRPVLLIHFPNQKSGNDINAVLPELLEHDIIADMLGGQINNPEDLAAFLLKRDR